MHILSDSGPGVMSVFGQRVCVDVTVSCKVKARRRDARGLIQENQDRVRPGLMQPSWSAGLTQPSWLNPLESVFFPSCSQISRVK